MAPTKRISSKSVLALSDLNDELRKASDPKRAKSLAWFFKTGKGEYGEGDQFCGITVPELRNIASRFRAREGFFTHSQSHRTYGSDELQSLLRTRSSDAVT